MNEDKRSDVISESELSGAVGPPDVTMMRSIRNVFLDAEPLVVETSFDSVIHPQELRIEFSDGIGSADVCRLDITWFRSGAYRFHYIDSDDTNWRFDRHPNPHSPEKHFHEPPNAPSESAVKSCITVEEPGVVARAVLSLWRRAYDADSLELLNTADNPP